MRMVKICGVTTPDAVAAALHGGATHLGFVFVAASPRAVTPAAAAMLAAPARGRARIVALTADAGDDALAAVEAALAPDLHQLHGREDPARVAAVKARGPGVIKALGVAGADDLAGLERWAGADHLLLDAKPPAGAALTGGTGRTFDWTLLEGANVPVSWFLAGGLTPETVGEALRRTGAPGADVSSGVEARPGLKDPRRVAAFLAAAHAVV